MVMKYLNLDPLRKESGDFISKHFDRQPDKVLVQLFYFNYFWDVRWGGSFRLFSNQNNQELLSLPPWMYFSFALKPNQQAWHEVTPVAAAAKSERLSLQVIWLRK